MTVKLNLGCGSRRMDGFVNVDVSPVCRPDLLVDLNRTPWPFRDNSADGVVLSHVLEHLGPTGDEFLAIMRELYRICCPDAHIEIYVPHPRHDDFLVDPTHVRAVLPETFLLFSKAKNREWQTRAVANTPLGLYLDVDFEVVRAGYILDEPWRSKRANGELNAETLDRHILTQNNIVKQVEVTLAVRKPSPAIA